MPLRRPLLTGALAVALVAPALPAQAETGSTTRPAITRTEAQQRAKAGVLTRADLPQYEVERNTRDATDAQFDVALYKCIGVKAPKYLARNPGRSFTSGSLSIDSSADVVATVKAATADMKAVGSKKGAACYEGFLKQYFVEQGAEVESFSVTKIPVAVANADQAFAFRITGAFSVEGTPLLLEALLVAARVGQTEIVVSPGRFGGGMPSLKQSKALTNKLAKRVAAI